MYTKIKMGGADYDIVIPSDYMIGRMVGEGLLAPLNYENIPNASYINESCKGWAYDPEDAYSVPYMWGTVGLIYNTTMIEKPVDSWEILWDQDYAGQILMFNNSRDAFAIALARLGLSFNPESAADVQAAAQLLKEQKTVNPSYVMDEIFDKLEGGEAAVGPYYAGDALVMIEENPDLAFVFPKEGTNYFVDAMCVLASSKQKEAAEMFINFMCETEIALANTEFTGYSTPHTGAFALLDEELQNSPIAYPSEEIMANTQVFSVLAEEINAEMDTAWSDIRSYDEAGSKWVMPVVMGAMALAAVLIMVNRARRKKRDEY